MTNLIPGVTFQLLAPSAQESGNTLEQVQVVIANDNSGVESTVNQFVTDYNSLISAINTQEGKTSSGTPEPLFGSPTLSLLQQQLLGSLNHESPDGYLDPVSSSAGVTLSGSISISLAGGIPLDYSGTAGSDAQASPALWLRLTMLATRSPAPSRFKSATARRKPSMSATPPPLTRLPAWPAPLTPPTSALRPRLRATRRVRG